MLRTLQRIRSGPSTGRSPRTKLLAIVATLALLVPIGIGLGSAVSGFFSIDSWPSSVERRNFVFGPATLVTGCRPMVLVTTPPQPASKARMMLESDSVGGADDSRNGFSNLRPVNVTDRSTAMGGL